MPCLHQLVSRGVDAQAVLAAAGLGRVSLAVEGAPFGRIGRLTDKVERDSAPALQKRVRRQAGRRREGDARVLAACLGRLTVD